MGRGGLYIERYTRIDVVALIFNRSGAGVG